MSRFLLCVALLVAGASVLTAADWPMSPHDVRRTAAASSAPVFRYALERWPAAAYEVFVIHQELPREQDCQALEALKRLGVDGDNKWNFTVHDVDLDADLKDKREWQAIFEKDNDTREPWVVVRYPANMKERGDLWAGSLQDASYFLLQSPVRKEIVRRLALGHSAVWLLLESGDKARDDAAAAKLAADLPVLQRALKVPEQDPNDPDLLLSLPLAIEFSVLRAARDGADEKLLVSSLLHSESDLPGLAGPMVFPIFGRGRALPALVGKGINSENLEHAALFITGASACEIKDATPGFDLLLPADWNVLLEQHLVRERRPELSGLAKFLPPENKKRNEGVVLTSGTSSGSEPLSGNGKIAATPTEGASTAAPSKDAALPKALTPPADALAPDAVANPILLRNVLLVVIGGLVLVTALTVIFFRR